MIGYSKICFVCGKAFKAKVYNSRYCSKECRNESLRKIRNPNRKRCPSCGKELADCRQKWCLDCLLNDYKETHSSISYKRLCNRGYDKIIIEEELKKRMQ